MLSLHSVYGSADRLRHSSDSDWRVEFNYLFIIRNKFLTFFSFLFFRNCKNYACFDNKKKQHKITSPDKSKWAPVGGTQTKKYPSIRYEKQTWSK